MSQSSEFSFGNLSFNPGSQSVSALQENVAKRNQGKQAYNHHERIQEKREAALKRRKERAALRQMAQNVHDKVTKITQKLDASKAKREANAPR